MKILFDQAVPLPIRPFLRGHVVRTAFQEGWSSMRNGDSIQAAEEAAFHLLLTTDRNIRYQQNLAGRRIALLVIDTQQWPRLRPHMELVVAAINAAEPGSYLELNIPLA
jgi:hypothetical protein